MTQPFHKLASICLCGHVYNNIDLYKREYRDCSTAIELLFEDGERLATATSWIEGLQEGEVAIKDYSENEGMYHQLVEFGVIQPAHRYGRSGFIQFPICRLAEPAGLAGTSKEHEMQQKSIKEFISEQLGEDTDDIELGDYMTNGELDELFETGSIELDINDEVTIRVVTSCELVAKEPTPEMPDL